ncbi:MAG: FG-GAP repeat protein, partial [Gemmataceae bacterium]|nr:FG-GAP repeat protein [Gemmataceae bacterium]
TTFLSANTYTGKTFVLGGSIILNANQASDFIVDGGTLSGSATIGKLEAKSGSVSPSFLLSNDISLSSPSALNLTIRGTSPGVGSDQITTHGTVALGNATLNLSGSFNLKTGEELILVHNDGVDPVSGTFKGIANNQIITIQGTSYLFKYDGGDGNDITLTKSNTQFITVGTIATSDGSGFKLYSADNSISTSITPFKGFFGEIRVSSNSDFDSDGVNDIVAAAGPGGGPRISIFSGANGNILFDFFAYNPSFSGGVFVASGDVTGDGVPDLVTGAGATGGPHVIVWDGASLTHNSPTSKASFFAYAPTFLGGVSVATGDLNGDGVREIITGAGIGGAPQVNVYSSGSFALLHSFFAYDIHFSGGIFVAAGDLTGDHHAEIITGTGQGGDAKVNLFDGQNFQMLGSFSPYQQGYNGGVRVGAADYYGTGKQNIITGAGNNIGQNPNVKIFDFDTTLRDSIFTGNSSGFQNGVFVS